jgi:hypothetical protein
MPKEVLINSMNVNHEPKITNYGVGKLINSGAIACSCRLVLGHFESHVRNPELISASLGSL